MLHCFTLPLALTIVRGVPEQLVYGVPSLHAVAFYVPAVVFVPPGLYHLPA